MPAAFRRPRYLAGRPRSRFLHSLVRGTWTGDGLGYPSPRNSVLGLASLIPNAPDQFDQLRHWGRWSFEGLLELQDSMRTQAEDLVFEQHCTSPLHGCAQHERTQILLLHGRSRAKQLERLGRDPHVQSRRSPGFIDALRHVHSSSIALVTPHGLYTPRMYVQSGYRSCERRSKIFGREEETQRVVLEGLEAVASVEGCCVSIDRMNDDDLETH